MSSTITPCATRRYFQLFSAILRRTIGRVFAPRNSRVFLRNDFGVFDVLAHFGFNHVDRAICFRDEIGLIFALGRAPLVKDLELAACRLERLFDSRSNMIERTRSESD
jgi:hypothetical protein